MPPPALPGVPDEEAPSRSAAHYEGADAPVAALPSAEAG